MAGIDAAAAQALLELIVAIPTINPVYRQPGEPEASYGEEALATALAGWMHSNGLRSELDEALPGRPNLIARIRGTASGPAMLWEGHLDTVQVIGMEAPFVPRLEDGRLHGRGAVDDGGCVAAFLLALRALAADPPPGDVELLLAVDEESGSRGILHHLARGDVFALGVAGEPTELRVVRACKGVVRWWVTLIGRPGHTAHPDEAVNAIEAGRRLLDAYAAEMTRRTTRHPLLGHATLVCTAFEAGEGPNTVPGQARLRFDYRCLPDENGAEIHATFTAAARSVAQSMPGLQVEVGTPFVEVAAMDVPETAAPVRRMISVCADHGLKSTPLGVPFGSDAIKMVSAGGIPTIVFGPGSIDQAHGTDEYVEIAQVVQAAQMLVEMAWRTE